MNGKIWSLMKGFCIPRSVWIEDYQSHSSKSKILKNFVSAQTYNIDLKDCNMDYINKVAKTYSKVLKDIAL